MSGANTQPAYYNENDPRAAAWLRELIEAGHIARGIVDERSIEDVYPSDLDGFAQCHFFAGIGGWSLALRLAGVPDDYAVWTGSCPCQPFSAAGRRSGFADERHLWPAWFHLIAQRRPKLIFGEQVASALGWLDLISTDLENEAYAVGAAIIGAHSVGAPHIRQRLYFVADSDSSRWKARERDVSAARHGEALAAGSGARELANADGGHSGTQREQRSGQYGFESKDCSARELGDSDSDAGGRDSGTSPSAQREVERQVRSELDGPWTTVDWLPCRDGKSRPTQRGIHPLVNGLPDRVGLLRGYGNAIVPQLAAAFIEAALA